VHDACTFCGRILEPSEFQQWTLPQGESVVIPQSDCPYVIVDLARGETCICEACYQAGSSLQEPAEDMLKIHYEFGLAFSEKGDYPAALRAYRAALDIRETPDILTGMARACDGLGQPEQEIALLRRALQLEPGHRMAEHNLIVSLARCGHLDEAMEGIARLLTAEPRDAGLWMLRAEVLFKRGAPGEAEAAYEKAKEKAHCETCCREYDERWNALRA
jgi:tetratricopeptide (TPR) repeat protein